MNAKDRKLYQRSAEHEARHIVVAHVLNTGLDHRLRISRPAPRNECLGAAYFGWVFATGKRMEKLVASATILCTRRIPGQQREPRPRMFSHYYDLGCWSAAQRIAAAACAPSFTLTGANGEVRPWLKWHDEQSAFLEWCEIRAQRLLKPHEQAVTALAEDMITTWKDGLAWVPHNSDALGALMRLLAPAGSYGVA